MHPDGDSGRYGLLKMSVNFSDALNFWRTVEQRYQDRKRRYLEANSRLVAARLAAMRARKEMDKARWGIGCPTADATSAMSASPSSPSLGAEPEITSSHEEFSDGDSDIFADPESRYYSSLNMSAWQRMRHDLATIHMKGENPMEKLIRIRTRKRILVCCLVFIFVAFGLFVIFQWFQPYSTEPLVQSLPPCGHCDTGSLLDEIINAVIPRPSMDDQL